MNIPPKITLTGILASAMAAAIMFLSACGQFAPRPAGTTAGNRPPPPTGISSDGLPVKTVMQALQAQYRQWRGTPYKLGGLSDRGIDCSGFVLLTFRDRFGIALPRSTEHQATQGRPVERNRLQTGDLVFFKTTASVNHVGIFMENGEFLHASSSRGVMISRMDNVFWKRRFWKARRITPLVSAIADDRFYALSTRGNRSMSTPVPRGRPPSISETKLSVY